MHITIRKYKTDSPKEVTRLVNEGFFPLIEKVAGFVAYYGIETGEDGREVLKIIYAAYESAGTGRRIDWPYTPRKVGKPIELWRG